MGATATKESPITLQTSNEKLFQFPIFMENDVCHKKNLTTSIVINDLLREANCKIHLNEYTEAEEILQLATNLGSPRSAAILGYVNLQGLNSTQCPNYALSAAYYLIALKFIKAIPNTEWDISLILEVAEGLTELYRFHFDHQRDLLIWNHGIKVMKFLDNILKDPNTSTIKEVQKVKALRIHIAFCLALTAEIEGKFTGDYREAVNLYHKCEQIGRCELKVADKLIKKAHTKFRLLEPRVPRIQPICATCKFEAKDLKTIWNLLVCSQCQNVACCSRECLKNHLNSHKK
uniref:Mediator of RNA polymerase II transcription subunit 7 n=1 Tax=Anthurium amnicola TaxID=1678845 RepID=A0A1D1Y0L4_9ARAE